MTPKDFQIQKLESVFLITASKSQDRQLMNSVNKRTEEAKAEGGFLVLTKSEYQHLMCIARFPADRPMQRYKGQNILVVSDQP